MNIQISHHLLLCATPNKGLCCPNSKGKATWETLKELLKKLNLENHQRPEGIVLRSKVDCLRVCKEGPILLVWPDGIWYGEVTRERIEVIIYKHIIEGIALKDWMIKCTPLSCNPLSINQQD